VKEQWPVYFGYYCTKYENHIIGYVGPFLWTDLSGIQTTENGLPETQQVSALSLPVTKKGTYALQGNYRKPFSCY